jgi:hypothetical protein
VALADNLIWVRATMHLPGDSRRGIPSLRPGDVVLVRADAQFVIDWLEATALVKTEPPDGVVDDPVEKVLGVTTQPHIAPHSPEPSTEESTAPDADGDGLPDASPQEALGPTTTTRATP